MCFPFVFLVFKASSPPNSERRPLNQAVCSCSMGPRLTHRTAIGTIAVYVCTCRKLRASVEPLSGARGKIGAGLCLSKTDC